MSDDTLPNVNGTSEAVKAMYEVYPYPSPLVSDSVIDDVSGCLYSLYGERSLSGWRILDAGCGTGHRLVSTARRYPAAHFIGIDLTPASLVVARRLAERHKVANIEFYERDLLDLRDIGNFDLITSTGVIHHLEDPQQGLKNLSALLEPTGLLIVWLYNSVGEHNRLKERELLQLMWDPGAGLSMGIQTMRDLDLYLDIKRYGSSASQRVEEVSRLTLDVDAYIHPIVHAYTFAESLSMLRQCPELNWAGINNVNLLNQSKLIDLGESERSDLRSFCQTVDSMFDKESLRRRFRELDRMAKLRVIELVLKPTGFTVISGRQFVQSEFGPRVHGNVLSLR